MSTHQELMDKYELQYYHNRLVSSVEFGGDYETADLVGRLYDRWSEADDMAAHKDYNDQLRNEYADRCLADYENVRAMLKGQTK